MRSPWSPLAVAATALLLNSAFAPAADVRDDVRERIRADYPSSTRRLAKVFTEWLGADRVSEVEPISGAEDFSLYGQTAEPPVPEPTITTGVATMAAAVLELPAKP